ncbi:hypothetical protein GQ600_17832 [Phytophthora cactorum]|nr:hypothetical protein GQ600_17832 [Phytophthora cactorum]
MFLLTKHKPENVGTLRGYRSTINDLYRRRAKAALQLGYENYGRHDRGAGREDFPSRDLTLAAASFIS